MRPSNNTSEGRYPEMKKATMGMVIAEKVFHLHLRVAGDNDELYFRDYLKDNPLVAKQYEELKLSLWKQFEHNRDGYTLAKTAFIAEQTEQAKKVYGQRYLNGRKYGQRK